MFFGENVKASLNTINQNLKRFKFPIHFFFLFYFIIFNEDIIKEIIQPKYLEAKYPQYFQPEIQPFMNEEWFPKYETESNKSDSSSINNNSTMNKSTFGPSNANNNSTLNKSPFGTSNANNNSTLNKSTFNFSFGPSTANNNSTMNKTPLGPSTANNNSTLNKSTFNFSTGFSTANNNSAKNEWVQELEKELPDDFYEMRKSGENENYICKLIRNDSVEEFIAYVNKNNFPLKSLIKSSIFKTNSFLIKKQSNNNRSDIGFGGMSNDNSSQNDKDDKLTLIKYAAFFRSIQIFKYLQINGVELTPQLWYFAIHGKNAEIIHLLEENHIEFENLYEKCFEEATKCHYNEIANYFLSNFLQNNEKNANNSFIQGLKYYNFSFLQNELINENSLCCLCQYDYYYFIYFLMNYTNIDINKI